MKKLALVLHGWPQHDISDHLLVRKLKDWGYDVFTPDLFKLESEFSLKNLQSYISEGFGDTRPDLMIGMSMGGIILPYVAEDYPETKLIFVATGTRLKTNLKLFNLLLKAGRNRSILKAAGNILKLPNKILEKFYLAVNPFDVNKDRQEQEEDMIKNIESIKDIPVIKEAQIVEFVTTADTSRILKNLKNRSLIFSGKKDRLMPIKLGEQLHELLINSEFIVNNGEHFNVLGEKELEEIKEFLSSS